MSLIRGLRLGSRLAGSSYHWVTAQVAVGPYPNSLLLRCLELDGVNGVLDVSGREQHHPARREAQVVKRPLIDGPGNSLRQLGEAVKALDELVAQGRTVYVHCMEGVNRGPAVVAAWLVWQGVPAEDALERVRRSHPPSAIHPELVRMLSSSLWSRRPSPSFPR